MPVWDDDAQKQPEPPGKIPGGSGLLLRFHAHCLDLETLIGVSVRISA
jgi:hypothetical protein